MIRARTLPQVRRPRMRLVQLDEGEQRLWQARYEPMDNPFSPWTDIVAFLGVILSLGITGKIQDSIFVACAALLGVGMIFMVRQYSRCWKFAYTLTDQRIILSSRTTGRIIAEISLDGLESELRPRGPTLWLFPRDPELSANWPFRYRTARRMPGLAEPHKFQELLSTQRPPVVAEFAMVGEET